MLIFDYIALNTQGEHVKGSIRSNTEAGAIQQLRISGLYPTSVKEQGAKPHEESEQLTKVKKIRKLTIMERILGEIEL